MPEVARTFNTSIAIIRQVARAYGSFMRSKRYGYVYTLYCFCLAASGVSEYDAIMCGAELIKGVPGAAMDYGWCRAR